MKKLLVAAVLGIFAVSVQAHGGHWRHHPHYGWGWTVPVIVGGAIIGYEISRSQQPPVVVQQQPVIVQSTGQPPVFQNCSQWIETQNSDGTITRTRTCQ